MNIEDENRSQVHNPGFRTAGDDDVAAGRAGTQGAWYEFSSTFCDDQEVIDVGCGMGKGLEILSTRAKKALGIDMDERLENENIKKKDIGDVEDKCFDNVICIDVIEHVEDDHAFASNLARVARKKILLSTPNYAETRCTWPYHIREYMPDALYKLFSQYGKVTLYKGNQYGDIRFIVKYPAAYFLLCRMRINPIVGFFVRIFNKSLPSRARMHGHLFINVEL
jgi:SAM-dependent methyltransferase